MTLRLEDVTEKKRKKNTVKEGELGMVTGGLLLIHPFG